MGTLADVINQYIVEPISTITFADVVDILLLGTIIYILYRFIRERRGGKLVLGLLVPTGLLGLSTLFNFRAVTFVFQNFYQIGMIAIIVIFQPELRAALEKVGTSARILGMKSGASSNKDVHSMIESVCKAVEDFSKSKTGAIMVFERNTKLGEHIKTGIILNADVSVELLKNIFFINAPLHDGAVIIRNNHIYSAGCFLPLTMGEGVHSALGSRHRAAIGMSEVSDAAVVVVSEETGAISMAYNGTLNRGLTRKELSRELSRLMITQVNASPARKHKRNNVGANVIQSDTKEEA